MAAPTSMLRYPDVRREEMRHLKMRLRVSNAGISKMRQNACSKCEANCFILPLQSVLAIMKETAPQFNDLLLYTTPDGGVKVDVIYEGETFWLSQKKMAELFGVERSVVTKHIQNVFKKASWRKIQYVHFLHILPPTEKPTTPSFTTSMPSSPSATA
jgi:hypothetical protein